MPRPEAPHRQALYWTSAAGSGRADQWTPRVTRGPGGCGEAGAVARSSCVPSSGTPAPSSRRDGSAWAHSPQPAAMQSTVGRSRMAKGPANQYIAPRLGLPPLAVVTWPEATSAEEEQDERQGLHWKTRTLVRWAAGRAFAWLDDEITNADRAWVAVCVPKTASVQVRCVTSASPRFGLPSPWTGWERLRRGGRRGMMFDCAVATGLLDCGERVRGAASSFRE